MRFYECDCGERITIEQMDLKIDPTCSKCRGVYPFRWHRYTKEALADEIIDRLNKMIVKDDVKRAISELIKARIAVEDSECFVRDHPAIQCGINSKNQTIIGFLGVLNGIVGIISNGDRKGWGLITAVMDKENPNELNFIRTKE